VKTKIMKTVFQQSFPFLQASSSLKLDPNIFLE
jgi:hypothetical protein